MITQSIKMYGYISICFVKDLTYAKNRENELWLANHKTFRSNVNEIWNKLYRNRNNII